MSLEKVSLEGLVSGEELDHVYKKRNVKFIYKKVIKQNLQPFIDEGWGKTGYRSKNFLDYVDLKRLVLILRMKFGASSNEWGSTR